MAVEIILLIERGLDVEIVFFTKQRDKQILNFYMFMKCLQYVKKTKK